MKKHKSSWEKTRRFRRYNIYSCKFKPKIYGLKVILEDFKQGQSLSQSIDLGNSFPTVLESPQSELRFESYGQNSFRPNYEELSTARDQY